MSVCECVCARLQFKGDAVSVTGFCYVCVFLEQGRVNLEGDACACL